MTVGVYVFSENYAESVRLAEAVRSALDGTAGRYDTFEVDECDMTDADEAFSENVFMQQLTFELKTYGL